MDLDLYHNTVHVAMHNHRMHVSESFKCNSWENHKNTQPHNLFENFFRTIY